MMGVAVMGVGSPMGTVVEMSRVDTAAEDSNIKDDVCSGNEKQQRKLREENKLRKENTLRRNPRSKIQENTISICVPSMGWRALH